jgi:hypothetical protein
MPKTRRVVSIVCLVVFLAVPLVAQSERAARQADIPLLSFLSALWERLAGPVPGTVSVSEADGTNPEPTPAPGETGRGGWDPNG